MDLVDKLKAFVATAQTGSFTAAADQLGVSNRLTSKYVADLEAQLGVRLFQRTTRKVGLTPAGTDLLARAPVLLDDLDDLLAEVSEGSRGLTGVIRIAGPVIFGDVYLAGMLGRFARHHPDLTFDVRLHDSQTDLASEGIDVAFRIGQSQMLSLKARKLGEVQSMLVASPDYIATYGAPETPAALATHCCIVDTNRRRPRHWAFYKGTTEHDTAITGRFHVNSARAAVELASAGLGLAYAPHFAFREALASGRIVQVMKDYTGDCLPVSAVYLEGRALPRKVRALIDFAVKDFGLS
jgi:DNA-binding transcriptional LysR family regulator